MEKCLIETEEERKKAVGDLSKAHEENKALFPAISNPNFPKFKPPRLIVCRDFG